MNLYISVYHLFMILVLVLEVPQKPPVNHRFSGGFVFWLSPVYPTVYPFIKIIERIQQTIPIELSKLTSLHQIEGNWILLPDMF